MKQVVLVGLVLFLASCSSAGWLERLETRYGPGASVDELRAELETEGFNISDPPALNLIQGGYIIRNGQTIRATTLKEYLGIDCAINDCEYFTAGRYDSFLGWLLTRRYHLYVAHENRIIVAIGTEARPWRWLDFK